MKKKYLILILAGALMLSSCKGKDKSSDETSVDNVSVNVDQPSYTFVFTPMEITNEVGETFILTDKDGNAVAETDENGDPNVVIDGSGNAIPATDAQGSPKVSTTDGGSIIVTSPLATSKSTQTTSKTTVTTVAPTTATPTTSKATPAPTTATKAPATIPQPVITTASPVIPPYLTTTLSSATTTTTAAPTTTVTDAPSKNSVVLSVSANKSGDTVSVSVNITQNPGILAYGIELSYDSSALELVSASGGIGPVNESFYSQYYTVNPYFVGSIVPDAKTDFNGTGSIASYTFKVKNGFEGKTVRFSTLGEDFSNSKLQQLSVSGASASLTL